MKLTVPFLSLLVALVVIVLAVTFASCGPAPITYRDIERACGGKGVRETHSFSGDVEVICLDGRVKEIRR